MKVRKADWIHSVKPVDVLFGPVEDDHTLETVYLIKASTGVVRVCDANELRLPPYAERWQNVFINKGPGPNWSTRAEAEGGRAGMPSPTHMLRHYQQNEGEDWKVERVEL